MEIKTTVFINTVKFTALFLKDKDEVQLLVKDNVIETYECKDAEEANITFNTMRDTLEYISIHALSKL